MERAYAQALAKALHYTEYPWDHGTVVVQIRGVQTRSKFQWLESSQLCQLLLTIQLVFISAFLSRTCLEFEI